MYDIPYYKSTRPSCQTRGARIGFLKLFYIYNVFQIAYGLDDDSMDSLVAETEAKAMRGKTAVYMDIGRDVKNTHFRPYDVPAKVWVERYAEVYDEVINEGGR